MTLFIISMTTIIIPMLYFIITGKSAFDLKGSMDYYILGESISKPHFLADIDEFEAPMTFQEYSELIKIKNDIQTQTPPNNRESF
jgi:hypothetical protein